MNVFSLLDQDEIKYLVRGFQIAFLERKVNSLSPTSLRVPRSPPARRRVSSNELTSRKQPSCSFVSLKKRSRSEPRTTIPRIFVKVRKMDQEAINYLKFSRTDRPKLKLNSKEKFRSLNLCLAAAKDINIKVEAYKDRSRLLRKMGAEDLAIIDANRALALEPSDDWEERFSRYLKAELQHLKDKAKKCLKKRKDYRRIAIEYCFHQPIKEGVKTEIMKYSRKIQEPGDHQTSEIIVEDFPHSVWKKFSGQQRSLSDKVEISYDEENGWHWRAKYDISAGDTLSIEDYFALKLSPLIARFYCSFCTIWLLGLVPCTGCQSEMYCSENCRDEAWNGYHRTECKVLKVLPELEERELTLLALRIFLIATKQGPFSPQNTSTSVSWVESLESDRIVYDSMYRREERPELTFKNDYHTVLTLMWRPNGRGRIPFSELLPYTLQNNIFEVFVALRKINFFEDGKLNQLKPTFTREERLAIVLLVHHAALLLHNQSTMKAFYFEEPKDKIPNAKEIGLGLHTLHSFMNNSCNPAAGIVRDRRRELVYAVRNIRQGDQICISYVGSYGAKRYQDRCDELKTRYNMECSCEACTGDEKDWPYWMQEIKSDLEIFLRDDFVSSNLSDREKNDAKKRIEKFRNRHFDKKRQPEEHFLQELLTFQRSDRPLLKNPSEFAWFCDSSVRVTMAMLRGNFQTPDRLKKEPPLLL